MRFKTVILLAAATALLSLCACGRGSEPVETADPYEGMVQVESGFGTKMWVELYEDVPVNDIPAGAFRWDAGFIKYTGDVYETRRGIDVSEHQGEIDWKAVASHGIDFAMIRAGYRGYSEGGLYVDEYFFDNLYHALENDIQVGLYFFSQAVTPEEAAEEADFLLGLLDSAAFDVSVSLPVAFDWENIDHDDARTDGLDGKTLTDCAIAFCERIKQAGYGTAVYAYRNLAYFLYDLPRLTDYTLWIGALGDAPDFYYRHEIWQYSASGTVRGIDGPVDLNLYFVEKQSGAPGAAQPSAQPETGAGSQPSPAAPAPAAEPAAGATVGEPDASANAEVIIYDAGADAAVFDGGAEEKFSYLIEYDA